MSTTLSKVANRTAWTIALIIIFSFVACIFHSCVRPLWDYGHAEQNARRSITGSELQAWATNLLARYTNDMSISLSDLGTNFPPQLRGLAPQLGPYVYIHVLDTNHPPFVQVWWGSGFIGATGFYVGSTNFAYFDVNELTNGVFVRSEDGYYCHLWQPGVWFYRSN